MPKESAEKRAKRKAVATKDAIGQTIQLTPSGWKCRACLTTIYSDKISKLKRHMLTNNHKRCLREFLA